MSAFHLLLAEALLVQTKADDVAKVWPTLIRRFRKPSGLAKARLRMLVSLLRPLGLQNQRAERLKRIAATLEDRFRSRVPATVQNLLFIPHVGLYTAAAVASFKNCRRAPIVDANVLRVFSRLTGRNLGRDLRRSKKAWSIAWALLPSRGAVCGLHNYGILDFAAQVCTIRNPKCETCPLKAECAYGQRRLGLRAAASRLRI